MTIVTAESRDVVYVDDAASLEIIQAALKAWGLRIREEREERTSSALTQPSTKDPATTWETERPATRAPGRLDNELSPLWLPIKQPTGNEAVAAWSWFTRAA